MSRRVLLPLFDVRLRKQTFITLCVVTHLTLCSLRGAQAQIALVNGFQMLPAPGFDGSSDWSDYDWTGASVTELWETHRVPPYYGSYGYTLYNGGYYDYQSNVFFSNGGQNVTDYDLSVTNIVNGSFTYKWKWTPPDKVGSSPPAPDYTLYPDPVLFTLDCLYQGSSVIQYETPQGKGTDATVEYSYTPLYYPQADNKRVVGNTYPGIKAGDSYQVSPTVHSASDHIYTSTVKPNLESTGTGGTKPNYDTIGQVAWEVFPGSLAITLVSTLSNNRGSMDYLFGRPKETGDGTNQFVYDQLPQKFSDGSYHTYLQVPARIDLIGVQEEDNPDYPSGLTSKAGQWLSRGRVQVITDITEGKVSPQADYFYAPASSSTPNDNWAHMAPSYLLDSNFLSLNGNLLYTMPVRNSSFGDHKTTLKVSVREKGRERAVWTDSMVAEFQSFFKPFDSTYPPTQADPNLTPNWFYYYKQQFNPAKPVFFQNPLVFKGQPLKNVIAFTDYASIYFGADVIGKNSVGLFIVPVFGIYDMPQVDGSSKRLVNVMGFLNLKGIEFFTWVLGHELGHNMNRSVGAEATAGLPNDQDPLSGVGQMDHLGDGLNDNWEARNNFDSKSKDTTGYYGARLVGSSDEGYADRECLADMRAFIYFRQADLWQYDWAKDSVQWGVHPVSTMAKPYHGWTFQTYNAITKVLGAEQYEITANDVGVTAITDFSQLDGGGM